jgi:hypothetical protein
MATPTFHSELLARLFYDLLKYTLPANRLQAYLPLQTRLRRGDNYVHIVNASVFTLETQHHVIYEGSSLCARQKRFLKDAQQGDVPTCPGCIAHAKGVITRSLGL